MGQSEEERSSDMRDIEERTGTEDDEPLSQLRGTSTLETLSGLARKLVPILVPALVPALTDGIRDALPNTKRPHQKTPKNQSRGIRELRKAQREEREHEDSAERRSILVSE
jgi:hypothetical protein